MFRRGSLFGSGIAVRFQPITKLSSSSSIFFKAALPSTGFSQKRFNSTTPGANSSTESATSTKTTSGSASASSVGDCATKEEESNKIARLLEEDPKLLEEVIARMSGEQRRRFTVAGGAYEWFGKDKVSTELVAADADEDKMISPKDFNNWFDHALKRHTDHLAQNPEAASNKQSTESKEGDDGEKAKGAQTVVPKVAKSALFFIALETSLPFVGFGFLDNATMILAGDAIDKSLGAFLHCSVMASAAMGNVVSGMMGMQVHGFVEKMVHKLGLPTPILTPEQQRSQPVFMAGHLGGTVGIFIGLTLGMLPLFIIKSDEAEEEHVTRKWFDALDTDKSGKISPTEVQKGLRAAGVDLSLEEVTVFIKEHTAAGVTDGLDYEDFKRLHTIVVEGKTLVATA